ncbi:hypothetical protein [Mesorhizobium sp.]|uniref:hypothetical protein n=1 Tax=Mesorhizobium sp. TaxID=1871066 RepID=UPI00345C226A
MLYAHIRRRDVVPLTGTGGEKAEVRIRPASRSENSLLNHQALLSGVGIGLGHKMILDPLIAEGRLEHVLPDRHYAPHHVHASTHRAASFR